MTPSPELSVIIVSYNVRQLLTECIASVINSCRDIEHEIIVVDNASADGSAEAVKNQFPKVKIIANPKNSGFSAANNQGYKISRGRYILLLNPDTMVNPGAVKTVLEFLKASPKAGLAGCRLLTGSGRLQPSIINYPSITENILTAFYLDRFFYRNRWEKTYYREGPLAIDIPAGAFMMVSRQVLGQGPLFDEGYFMYSEEAGLSWRLKAKGFQNYYVPGVEIIHLGEQSTSPREVEMYRMLQASKLKFYYGHYSPAQAFFLSLSLWLVLVSRLLTSVPLLPFKGYGRLRLFWLTAIHFPPLWRRAAVKT
ncbi:MAG: glycosyltransferase family 2 protein [bacterium]|nr:glycosyltransferase family 2 protein [bacterium]